MRSVEGWTKLYIADLGEIITGSTPDTKNDAYWGGEIPFVSPADFKSCVFVRETAKTLSAEGSKQARTIPPNSIMVTCIGSIGSIAVAPFSCVTNQQINSVICDDTFDWRFVFYSIQHNIPKLHRLAGMTTLPIINKNTFGSIEIELPTSYAEQAKIAEILSTVDRVIGQTKALIAKQQRIKTGLMQDLLTCGIDEHGNLRSEQTH
jgi:type I restriction enzyme, S subunit